MASEGAAAAAGLQRPPGPFAGVALDRRRVALIALLLGLAAAAWAMTDNRMAGMDAGPGTDPGSLVFYVTVWVVMMAAMMFPSIAPMVTVYSRLGEARREGGGTSPVGATAIFVGGYLVSWTAAGLLAYAIVKLGRSLSIEALSWDEAGPYVAGGVVVVAAVYQLTPLKDVCLRHCRGPLSFILTHWRDGRAGALRMGIAHGAWCVGCCWALMAALFALGIMSLGWMAFIAALIAVEKMLPWKAIANYGVAVVLLVLGIAVAFVPDRVPGLTLPDSAQARQAMMQMDGGEMKGTKGAPKMKGDMKRGKSRKDMPQAGGGMGASGRSSK